jgi:hypothetical protein
MTGDIARQFIVTLLALGIAYAFWLTYWTPDRNRVTRCLDWYVERARFPVLSHETHRLVVVAITVVTALVTLVLFAKTVVSEMW